VIGEVERFKRLRSFVQKDDIGHAALRRANAKCTKRRGAALVRL